LNDRVITKKDKTGLEEFPKLIKFIGGSDVIDIETQNLFHIGEYDVGTCFKVFCDDLNWDSGTFDSKSRMFEIHNKIAKSTFCWLT
jgi:hypothetical protein